MKKLLITGGTGFIGSHLAEMAVKKGYRVTVFDRYNSNNDWGWLEYSKLKGEIEVVLGDIRDYDSVDSVLSRNDIVFHLAALIGIPYSYVSPLAYIRTNIEGTYNVLESSRRNEIEDLIVTSTSETYGTAQYVPIDENHPSVGQSPYSATKISADNLALSYFMSFETPVKIARPFNTYGPRQSARAIIPTVFSAILSQKKEIFLGNLHPTRDLTYVTDTCEAFFNILCEKSFIGKAVNIGNSSEISILNLVKMICEICNHDMKITSNEERLRPDKSEVERLFCDNSFLLNNTSWKVQTELREGLKNTYEWMKEDKNFNFYKPDRYLV